MSVSYIRFYRFSSMFFTYLNLKILKIILWGYTEIANIKYSVIHILSYFYYNFHIIMIWFPFTYFSLQIILYTPPCSLSSSWPLLFSLFSHTYMYISKYNLFRLYTHESRPPDSRLLLDVCPSHYTWRELCSKHHRRNGGFWGRCMLRRLRPKGWVHGCDQESHHTRKAPLKRR